jgi:hypothetical protein
MLLASGDIPDMDRAFSKARATMAQKAPASRAATNRWDELRSGARNALAADVEAVATVCAAAATWKSPEEYLATIASSYAMNPTEAKALATKCRIFWRGRQEAGVRRTS